MKVKVRGFHASKRLINVCLGCPNLQAFKGVMASSEEKASITCKKVLPSNLVPECGKLLDAFDSRLDLVERREIYKMEVSR